MWTFNYRKKMKMLRFTIHNDPIINCELYKHKGCSHVDGMLCDTDWCTELKDYRKELERIKKKDYTNKIFTDETRRKVCL